MIQKEKELLLKDLCARLLYGVCVEINSNITANGRHILRMCEVNASNLLIDTDKLDLKPYLRPMSSMTEKELHEVQEILGKGVEIRDIFIFIVDSSINTFSYLELQAVFDWFNAHHFDYRGLIEKGLAIEAPKGMYN